MMQKRLLSLLLITVAVLGIGLILTQRQQPIVEGVAESGPLVPGLGNELNEIKGIRISGAGDLVIADLARQESGWVVSSRHDYPADFDKVREYLIKLSEAKLREAKTSKPENYSRLGVEDLAGTDAKGLGVELTGQKNPVKLIIGIASGGASSGTFVRRADEAVSYLVSGDVIPDKEGSSWLSKAVLDLPSTEVFKVAITAPDKSILAIQKADATAFDFDVLNLPKGRQLSSESAANAIAGALASVTLEDVMPAAQSTAEASGNWDAKYLAYDGFAVNARVWDHDGRTWASFVASVDEIRLDAWIAGEKTKADAARATAEAQVAAKPDSAPAKPDTDQAAATKPDQPPADAVADASTTVADVPVIPPEFNVENAKAEKQAELDKRVAELNAKTSPWVYAIPSWKAINFKKKLDDLLQPKS